MTEKIQRICELAKDLFSDSMEEGTLKALILDYQGALHSGRLVELNIHAAKFNAQSLEVIRDVIQTDRVLENPPIFN